MSQLLLSTSQCIFSNLIAQLFRQIVIQILGLESPKVSRNTSTLARHVSSKQSTVHSVLGYPKTPCLRANDTVMLIYRIISSIDSVTS
jgi:hypothetical protein